MFFFSSRRRHTRCALVTGVQTCALPISITLGILMLIPKWRKANMEDAAIAVAAWKDLAERLGAENKDLHDTLTSVRDRVRHLEDEIGRASCRERVCQYV